MNIILNQKNYSEYLKVISKYDNILLLPIYRFSEIHYQLNSILFYYIGILDSSFQLVEEYILNVNHYDIEFTSTNLDLKNKNIFVLDKKSVLKLNEFKNNVIFDINLLQYLKEEKFEKINFVYSHQYQDYKKIRCDIIPLTIHYQALLPVVNKILIILKKYHNCINDSDYLFYNDLVISNLFEIESYGIPFKRDIFQKVYSDKFFNHVLSFNQIKLYSEYNIYTSTGRASNKFGGINFSALTKNSKEREWIISEYKKEGTLVELDYTAYHLAILAKIISYKIPKGINMHEYLGKFYFNKEQFSDEEYKEIKTKTFNYLYGGIPDSLLHIPYFQKVKQLVYTYYNQYQSKSYIYSSLSERKIHFIEFTPYKLLNYILQLYEFELSMILINELLSFIQNKKINLLLYTYDSILLDMHNDELIYLDEIKKILSNDGEFSLKIKTSKTNYNELK